MIVIIMLSVIIILVPVTTSVRVTFPFDYKTYQLIASSLFNLFLSLLLMFFLMIVYSLLLHYGGDIELQSLLSLIILLFLLSDTLIDISIIVCRLCI